MDPKTIFWIKTILANDEVSSDEEIIEHFMNEGGLTHEVAGRWIALRPEYLREVFCDAEPEEQLRSEPVYQLPTFKGYTVDLRLREFRKAIPDVTLQFIPFNSPEGKKLLAEFQAFARELLKIDGDELN